MEGARHTHTQRLRPGAAFPHTFLTSPRTRVHRMEVWSPSLLPIVKELGLFPLDEDPSASPAMATPDLRAALALQQEALILHQQEVQAPPPTPLPLDAPDPVNKRRHHNNDADTGQPMKAAKKRPECAEVFAGDEQCRLWLLGLQFLYDARDSDTLCPQLVPPQHILITGVSPQQHQSVRVYAVFRHCYEIVEMRYQATTSSTTGVSKFELASPPPDLSFLKPRHRGGGAPKLVLIVVTSATDPSKPPYASVWKQLHSCGHTSVNKGNITNVPAEHERATLLGALQQHRQRFGLDQEHCLTALVAGTCEAIPEHQHHVKFVEARIKQLEGMGVADPATTMSCAKAAAGSVRFLVLPRAVNERPSQEQRESWCTFTTRAGLVLAKSPPLAVVAHAADYEALQHQLSKVPRDLYQQWFDNMCDRYPSLCTVKSSTAVLTLIAQAIVMAIIHWIEYLSLFDLAVPPLPQRATRPSALSTHRSIKIDADVKHALPQLLEQVQLSTVCNMDLAMSTVLCDCTNYAALHKLAE